MSLLSSRHLEQETASISPGYASRPRQERFPPPGLVVGETGLLSGVAAEAESLPFSLK